MGQKKAIDAQTKNILGNDGNFKQTSFSVKPSQKKLMKGSHHNTQDYTEAQEHQSQAVQNMMHESMDRNRNKLGFHNINVSQSSVFSGKSGSMTQHKTSLNDEVLNDAGLSGMNNSVDQGVLTNGKSYKVSSVLRGEGSKGRESGHRQGSGNRGEHSGNRTKASEGKHKADNSFQKSGPFIQNLNGSFNTHTKKGARSSATNKNATILDGKFERQVMHQNLVGSSSTQQQQLAGTMQSQQSGFSQTGTGQ